MRPLLVTAFACALVLPAPARAGEPLYGCQFRPMQQEFVTGSNYSVQAEGVVAHAGLADVTITCTIEVDGVEVGRTLTGTGTAVAATVGWIAYAASETSEVRGCAIATVAGHEVFQRCPPSRSTQIPPQEVVDIVEDVFEATYVADETLCPVLGGDVYVADVFVWDCPPYGT